MQPFRSMAIVVLVGALFAAPVAAQEASQPDGSSFIGSSEIETAVTSHESSLERTRGELTALLESDEVRAVAQERGVSMERLQSAASSMSDEDVHRAAPLVEQAKAALQSGGYITISVYTVIIILLLLILLT
jgi:hypothetical protein